MFLFQKIMGFSPLSQQHSISSVGLDYGSTETTLVGRSWDPWGLGGAMGMTRFGPADVPSPPRTFLRGRK